MGPWGPLGLFRSCSEWKAFSSGWLFRMEGHSEWMVDDESYYEWMAPQEPKGTFGKQTLPRLLSRTSF